MSELTLCNFCSLQSIRRRHKQTGARVYQVPRDGWIEIYVVPKNQKLDSERKKDGEPSDQFVASFMALMPSCVC